MPRQTLFNLPEEKRQAVIQAAIEEFADHDYASASVSRIVARAGIAKGSLYQYFEDKKELYLYLLDLAAQQKMAFLQAAQPPDPRTGLFPYLRWMVRVGVQFQLAHPRLSQVAYRAVYGHLPFKDELIHRVKEMSLEYFRQLVKQGIAQGDVDPSVDPELAAFVMNTVSAEFGFFITDLLGVDPERLARGGSDALDMEAVERAYDDLLRILEHGLGSNARRDGREIRETEDLLSDPRLEEEASR